MIEEALFGGFESTARRRFGLGVERARRAGDVGGLHRCVEIIMDDLEGPGIGVVDAGLSGRQPMFEHFIFDAVERQRPGRIEAKRLQVARSEEHTSELQSLMRISYAVFCLKKKKTNTYSYFTTI